MGIDLSQTVGYGAAGTYESDHSLPGRLAGLDWEQLQELEMPEGLVLDLGGDQMCGPYRWALLVESTRFRSSKYDQKIITKLEIPTKVEREVLDAALADLEIRPDFIGWHFFADVS